MSCNGKNYAIVKHHAVKSRFSDHFASSKYYESLQEPTDNLFYALEKCSIQIDLVSVENGIDMCIVFEDDDSEIVSPLSVYHEHD